jgi:DNA-binding transcriptional LysR family regulator
LAISAVVPTPAVIAAVERLAERYPTVGLNLRVEEVGGAAVLVRDEVCDLGVVGAPSLTSLKPDDVEQISLGSVNIVAVVATSHPLARLRRPLDNADLQDYRQLVPTSRAAPRYGNTLVHHTWEVADLPTRHALLRAGLGWGTLPEHLAHADLAAGRLVRLELSARSQEAMRVPIFAIHRPDQPPGPAGRAIIESLAGTGHPAA